MIWHHATGTLSLDRPRILGIVNVTPDSFSDGGDLRSLDDARRHVDRLVSAGADVIDIGGESTRPQGAEAVAADEELRRVIPVIAAVVSEHPDIPVSVDTVKARVASEAMGCGASIINDVSGFRLDSGMAAVCARTGAGVVVMHSRGGVAEMGTLAFASYGGDVTGEVIDELRSCIAEGERAGVERRRMVVDPGIGFAKRTDHSLRVLNELSRLSVLECPILVGVSRKRFIGAITGVNVPADRVAGTTGAHIAALERGARLFRAHDVRAAREALDVAWAIRQNGPS